MAGAASPFTIPTQFTAVDKFSPIIGKMSSAMNGFLGRSQRQLTVVNKAFSGLMTPITSLNKALMGLGYYVGLFTLVRIIKNAIDIFADFEQAQVDIRAVTQNNTSDTKMLADQARVLAVKYGEAATSILATDLALIKMGYSAKKAFGATEAILVGSVALKADPEELAKSVGASMMAFKLPEGSEQMVVDMYAKAADVSALDWKELQTMLPIAQGAASITGYTLPEMLGLFAAARNAQVHVASGSTAIKNMMVKAGIYDKDLGTMLKSISESPNKIKKAFKMFGPKTLVTALPLADAQAVGDLEKLIDRITNASKGYAKYVALIRLDSVRGAQKLLTESYKEFILSIEDGNGPIAEWAKHLLKVTSAMLLLASGSDAAKEGLKAMRDEDKKSAESWLLWTKIVGGFTAVILSLKVAIGTWSVLTKVGQGIMAFFGSAFAVASSFLLGIIGLGVKFRDFTGWFEKVMIESGADTMIEEMFARIGASIVKAVSDGYNCVVTMVQKLPGMFMDIGISIIKFMLEPIQLVLEALGKLTGADWAVELSTRMKHMGEETKPVPIVSNSSADSPNSWGEYLNSMNGTLKVDINDPGKLVKGASTDSSWIMPQVSSTNTFGN